MPRVERCARHADCAAGPQNVCGHVAQSGGIGRNQRMRTASDNDILSSLYDLIERLDDGARLPTVRDLMKKHRVSQATVQRALDRLRREGRLVSQVGRGTYVTRSGAAAAPRGDA